MTPHPYDFPSIGSVEDGILTPATFRAVMSQWVTGVAIVTASDQSKPVGIVCNSLASVSLDPLLLLWTVDRSSSSFEHWLKVDRWAVHFMADDQRHLIKRFAQKGGDKFAGLDYEISPDGIPLLANSLVRLSCKAWKQVDAGDHVILIGEVRDFQQRQTTPLTFVHGSIVTGSLSTKRN